MGALIAAKPRIEGMIRDAVWAGLLPEQILETRFSDVIETATSTYLSALDSDEQATAKLHVQKAPQAADEAWQQTIAGLQGLGVGYPTIASLEHRAPPLKMRAAMIWTSQRRGRADSVRRSSKHSFHDSLIVSSQAPEGHAPLKWCVAD